MTREQFRNTLKQLGITYQMLAEELHVTRGAIRNRINRYNWIRAELRYDLQDALKAIRERKGLRENGDLQVHWRFTERNVNADKMRGYEGWCYRPVWRPTTLYPIIQFGGPKRTPSNPPDMRFVLRDVVGEETAVQAFDRLVDTDSTPICWRDEVQERLAA